MNNGKDKKHKTTYKEVLMAFYEYLRRPKTVFDIKDRLKAFFFCNNYLDIGRNCSIFCQDVI